MFNQAMAAKLGLYQCPQKRSISLLLLLALMVMLVPASSWANTPPPPPSLVFGWNGIVDDSWSESNWDNEDDIPAPRNESIVVFGSGDGGTSNNDFEDIDLRFIYFDESLESSHTISGNQIDMVNGNQTTWTNNNAFIFQNSAASQTINAALSLQDFETNIEVNGAGDLNLNGNITNSSRIYKTGDGTLFLGGNNSGMTGDIDVYSGTIMLGNGDALSNTSDVWSSRSSAEAGTLDFNGTAENFGGLFGGVNVDLSDGAIARVGYNNFNRTFDGRVFDNDGTGAGSFVKAGTGTLTVTGDWSDFSGDITVSEGTLAAGGNNLRRSTVDVLSGAKLKLQNGTGFSTLGGLSGSGSLILNNGASNYVGDNNMDTTFSGIISDSDSGGGLFNPTNFRKRGNGTLILSGTNTYIGSTTIEQGVIQISKDENLGAVNNLLRFEGGTLRTIDDVVMSRGLSFSATSTLDVRGSLTLNGNLTGSSNADFTKSGAGALVLAGSNDGFFGDIAVNDGILRMGAGDALSDSTTVTLNGDAQLDMNSTAERFGGLSGVAGTTVDLSGNASLIIGANNVSTEFSGIIFGNGSLETRGSGTLTLGGINTYSGSTTIDDGVIQISRVENLGLSNSLILNGGTLRTTGDVAMSKSVVLGTGGGTLEVRDGPENLTLNGIVSGNDLNKTGAGTLTLGGTNTYSGPTIIDDGVIQISRVENLGSSTSLILNGGTSGGTLQTTDDIVMSKSVMLGAGGGNIDVRDGSENLTLSGIVSGDNLIKRGAGTLTLVGTNTYGTTNTFGGSTKIRGGVLQISRVENLGLGTTLEVSNSTLQTTDDVALSQSVILGGGRGTFDVRDGPEKLTLNGRVSGSELIKIGAGTLTLDGFNTYSGSTTIDDGVLQISSAQNLGSGTHLFLNGGTLQTTADVALSQSVVLGTGGGALGTFDVRDGSENLTLNGNLTGSRDLTKTGAGALVLAGSNNGYTGNINVLDGILRMGAGNALSDSTRVALRGDAQLDMNSTAEHFGGLIGDAFTTVDLSGNASLRIGANNNSTKFHGTIFGNGSLEKRGSGTLTLSGINTHSGGTTVSSGTLQLTNSAGIGTGNLTATNGSVVNAPTRNLDFSSGADIVVTNATVNAANLNVSGSDSELNMTAATINADINITDASLTGTGTITGNVTGIGAEFGPGNSPGLLAINGDFSLDVNSSLVFELGGTVAESEYDVLDIMGTADLAGELVIDWYDLGGGLFDAELGDSFDLLTAETIIGDFDFLTLAILGEGLEWDLDFLTDEIGSIDVLRLSVVTASAVPVPAAAWLFGSALLGLFAVKRKK